MNNQYQQGDVLLNKVGEFGRYKHEGKLLKRMNGGIVLAEGEVTGHAHVIEDNDAELVQEGERMLLSLSKESTLTHEEHKPIVLPPGVYEVGRVQEKDWLANMVRPVTD